MKLNWLRSEQPRFAVGLSVFAFVAGIGLALSFVGVSTAFQRSGALLIAFTIALAAFDLNFKLGEVMDDQNIQKWRILKLK